ncbi:MAG: VanZ family protein [Deltaproteobacteria bacterium]|nr:VanZ family protein [Deltaproteobacteria bacterium]
MKNNNSHKWGWIYLIFLFLYLSGVFALSNMSNPANFVNIKIWDKLAHFLEYTPIGFLLFGFINSFIKQKRFLFVSVFISLILLGLFDEFHQSFIPRRDSSLWDVMADTLGGLTGMIAGYLFKKKTSRTDSTL